MQSLVLFAHALADETRWRILRLVSEEALCVCELADILQMPQSSVSSHLQVIRKAGLLDSERCEKWIYYRLSGEFMSLLEEIRTHFAGRGGDSTWARDAKRAQKRLTQRASSCCPGPQQLAGSTSVTSTLRSP
ncbi:MAG TPA: metalloregulator ArsR/SmtB family transcription factor [Verrucomicrobiales bacterium]|jgi:ArsR family transcriptional regulator|nr:metalloregulator ArsR/SmtB family transcription factor [Verrucomicrobiales bacterium]